MASARTRVVTAALRLVRREVQAAAEAAVGHSARRRGRRPAHVLLVGRDYRCHYRHLYVRA